MLFQHLSLIHIYHLRYEGVVAGSQDQREAAIHMGAVFPWLLQFFAEAYLDIHGRSGLPYIKQLIEGFEEIITEHSLSLIHI